VGPAFPRSIWFFRADSDQSPASWISQLAILGRDSVSLFQRASV
jgi:hypothetical protein